MIDSSFRTPYQSFVINPLLRFKKIQKISPNLVTFFAFLSGTAILPLLYLHLSFTALICLVASGFFDTLDGSLARKRVQTSSIGTVFDITSDRLVEFAIILGLFLFEPTERALPAILMLGSAFICVTSFLIVGVFSENKSEKGFHYSSGLIERAEAFIFFALMILFPALFLHLAYLFAGLVFLTAMIRLYQFTKCSRIT